ncbi:glycosyltransferase [Paenibacillus nasutitermitis]|uniref:Glycosyl transferase n=1 Tax=Paenibacillus nasutitermitis TaxID=1652958 RepID=A0A917E0E1_9BACL|nr:glycosyltransferase [Paenibacillus nasutitermitis]GGD87494.1 glycosyl transferase [Paenibacillus nasutitermitis]
MAGPGIRYWNFAKVLSQYFEVVLFTPNHCELEADFVIKNINKSQLIEELNNSTCIIVQGMTLWNHSYIRNYNASIIVDLYDPFIFENIEIFNDDIQAHRASLSILMDQLYFGDYFICASEKQKDFWLGMLAAINRINPIEYKLDKTFNHLIGVVPFGMESIKPNKNRLVLKGIVPGIEKNDKVIIWGGGIWDWLDPLTAIRGMDILSKRRVDIKLFFMGINPPNSNLIIMENVKKTLDLSDSLGLTNNIVFFNKWTEYNDRHNYLLESDIGLNLHYNHIETRFSYRTRMLDYIWCGLPIITTKGDVLSEFVHSNNLGRVISPEDPYEFATAVEEVFSQNDIFIKGGSELVNRMSWENSILPLIDYCEHPRKSIGKSRTYKLNNLLKGRTHHLAIKAISYIKGGRSNELMRKLYARLLNKS